MKQLYPDLWQTSVYSSGMLNNHAYFLKTEKGNVLFYNTGDAKELDHIEELGGIKYQLITHRDEAGHSLVRIKDRFKSTLIFSELESKAIAKYAVADKLLQARDSKIGDVDVIFTPGHTSGSVCFYYKSPHGKSYLFTGDTFFQWNGKWATLVISGAGGSEPALIKSLNEIKSLTPDVVMSSGFVGSVGLIEPTAAEWEAAIDFEISELKLSEK